jgi:hypothetical protein
MLKPNAASAYTDAVWSQLRLIGPLVGYVGLRLTSAQQRGTWQQMSMLCTQVT